MIFRLVYAVWHGATHPHLLALKRSIFFRKLTHANVISGTTPHISLINLGIGDTTDRYPLPSLPPWSIFQGNGHQEGYVGYGPEQGMKVLREKIASIIYKGTVSPDDLFVSDGAKCDLADCSVSLDRT